MKGVLKRMAARVAPAPVHSGTRVLMYHAIDDPDPADRLALRVPRAQFRAQLECVRAEGYAVVPLDALFSPAPDERPRVAITFDDGYRSMTWATETLAEFGFPATCFVVPRWLDGSRTPTVYWEQWGHLDWEGAARLAGCGLEIGAHSATHSDLRRCSTAELEDETAGAKATLDRRLGRAVSSFSYPFGRHDERVRRAVERAGYRIACTSRYGENPPTVSRYAVRRTEITGADTLTDFRWKLRGKFDWLGYWQDLRPTA